MAQKTLAELMDERLAAIEGVVASLAEGGGQHDLRDLRVLLIEVVGLLKRDPGVEATADDLYAAATAIVMDSAVGAQPLARKQRLLRDARQRFHDRLLAAAERIGPDEYRDLQNAASVYATHRASSAPMIDLAWYRKMSA